MKENQYSYMSLNACCNLIILFFQSISLISECEYSSYDFNYGLFCSTVRKSLFSQFYRIIFIEYLTHVFYVMTNLAYICYSSNRRSLVGLNHGKFVTKISKLKVKKFILIVFFICLALPVPNIFTFKPNYFKIVNEYPDYIDIYDIHTSLVYVYLSFSIFYYMISSIGFIIANLVVDINLLLAMKQVMAERAENTSRAIQSNEITKK